MICKKNTKKLNQTGKFSPNIIKILLHKKGLSQDFIRNTLLSSNHLCMIFRVECDENCKVGPSCFRPFTRSLSQLTDSRKAISTRVPWCLFAIRLLFGLYYKTRSFNAFRIRHLYISGHLIDTFYISLISMK